MSERHPKEETNAMLSSEDTDSSMGTERLLGKFELQEDEVSYDDVLNFIDKPCSLPAEKIPSLAKDYGHINEIAERLIHRNDCPPKEVSIICQLHGNNPDLAEILMKNHGQLTDEDNRYIHQANRHEWSLTVNHLYHQNLTGDINWEIYNDHPDDRYILQTMAQYQSNLDSNLVRRFFDDHRHKPTSVVDLMIGQELPEDIIRSAFEDYKNIPEFLTVLFRHQKDLPTDLITEAYGNWDRSFEPVLSENSVSAEVFGALIKDVLDSILPDGGITIDLNTMRRVRVGDAGPGLREVPGEVFDRAHREYQNFRDFVLNLLEGSQLDEEMINTIYDDLGESMLVVAAMFGSQQSIPLDVISQGCQAHSQNIMFVEALFKNQKDLPRNIIEPIYKQHRWNPLFNGNWLTNQSNLTEKERKEASNWRPVDEAKTKLDSPTRNLGVAILSLGD